MDQDSFVLLLYSLANTCFDLREFILQLLKQIEQTRIGASTTTSMEYSNEKAHQAEPNVSERQNTCDRQTV
jgi:hypothetical protein